MTSTVIKLKIYLIEIKECFNWINFISLEKKKFKKLDPYFCVSYFVLHNVCYVKSIYHKRSREKVSIPTFVYN